MEQPQNFGLNVEGLNVKFQGDGIYLENLFLVSSNP